jgi:hypothetical protein
MCSVDDPGAALDERLADLIGRGYRFIHPRDKHGRVVAVVGIRAHHRVIDVIRLDAEDDVSAFRLAGDEADLLAPQRLLWCRYGTAQEVLNELLALADDEFAPAGVEDVRGCWIPGAAGQATWLAAAS